MRNSIRNIPTIFILLFVLIAFDRCSNGNSAADNPKASASRPTGFFLVAAEADSVTLLPKASDSKLPPAERVALNCGRRPRFKESALLVPTCFRSRIPREARGLQINQQLVFYDYKYLPKKERGKPEFLLISKVPDIPLLLSGAQELINKGRNGFPELRFKLTPDASIQLEELTRQHIGGKAAFLIDNEPVTLHKIKSAVVGGRFQLTRCTDTACRVIYGRLLQAK